VFVSGSFTDRATWLGGIVPTADLCSEVGGCGLYIAPQCVLSTESLNGELNIYFFQITVAFGATFQLGSSSVATNFQFFYSFSFNIMEPWSFYQRVVVAFIYLSAVYLTSSSQLNSAAQLLLAYAHIANR